ncbi:MAG TPA: hypothetical protein PLP05_00410 [Sedimentisphaerales bacterium]|nr:hypothetical protein [Sedimentisphaerales bacterium]
MKYRKKPVVIEAKQLSADTLDEIVTWIGDDKVTDGTSEDECFIGIQTLEGYMSARNGDWIIKGVKGEFYPCKPDIFEQTYELVEE